MPEQIRPAQDQTLCDLLVQRIQENPHQRITFAEFMELILYHPQHGYYAMNRVNIGAGGDFFTSPHLGADFGELLATQFVEIWDILGKPEGFTLVEMGAGQGLLAADVLGYLQREHPDCFQGLNYVIVEKAAALIAEQQQHLRSRVGNWEGLSWCSLEEIPPGSIVGCCFSNELVDALPVHQVTLVNNRLQEIYVTVQTNTGADLHFQDVLGELSTPYLAEYFSLVGINLHSGQFPNDYRTEVNLAALDWLATVADRLQRGYLLTIDYGYPAHRYYSPTRSQGTLQCYYQHAHHSDPYQNIGYQDVTAHVDFTALERQGTSVGLETLGFTQQGLFLMALGLGDRIAALSHENPASGDLNAILRRREALHLLINPLGLGNFGVLIQGKGLTHAEKEHPLRGLSQPSRGS